MGDAILKALTREEEACLWRQRTLRRQLEQTEERIGLIRLALFEHERERDRDAAEARRQG